MGIDVIWRGEGGAELAAVRDPKMLLSRFVQRSTHCPSEVSCLRFLDPYGDACFNQLQIPILLDELRNARSEVKEEDLVRHLDQVLALAEQAREIHTYLWFIGD